MLESIAALRDSRVGRRPATIPGRGRTSGFSFVDKSHVHFGVSAGGGRIDRHSAGLLAAVEPGLFVRLISDKAGAFHIDGGWYQPLLIRRDGVRGAAMISLGWSPFYGR